MRFLAVIFILSGLAGGAALIAFQPSRLEVKNFVADVFSAGEREQTVRLGFVGDIMMDREVKKKIREVGDGDYNFPFAKIKSDFEGFDFLFANLEGPVSDVGRNVGSIYSFRMDPQTVSAVKNAGFDAVSVANNHIGDWGREAMADTFNRLTAQNIIIVGGGGNSIEAFTPRVTEVKGLRIALIGASQFGRGYLEAGTSTPGIAVIDVEKLSEEVRAARSLSDLVIVSLHFGSEYELEHNSFQEQIAHSLIDAGADLIVGHHPHVIEPLEAYGRGYIVYSLGNFIFDQSFSKETMTGALFDVTVVGKKIKTLKLRPINLNEDFQPELALTP